MAVDDVSDKARSATEQVGRKVQESTGFDVAIRVGLASYGVMHLLIAYLALHLAFGDRAGQASKSGALHELVSQPFGEVLLWVIAAGFVALVLWQLLEAIGGHQFEEGAKRALMRFTSVGRACVFAVLAYSSVKTATGSSTQESPEPMTARLMSLPFGPAAVGLVGVAIAAYAVGNMYHGLSEGFTDYLTGKGTSGTGGTAIVTLGKVGYLSRGVAFLIVGGLFVLAAFTHDPDRSGGLDQALATLLQQPAGPYLLVAVAVGIGCFGVYCFAWARHVDR